MAKGGCIQNTKENIQKNGLTVSGVQNKKQPWDVWQMSSFVFHRRKEVRFETIWEWLNVHFSENYPNQAGIWESFKYSC